MLLDPKGGILTHQEGNTTVKRIVTFTQDYATIEFAKEDSTEEQPAAREHQKKLELGKSPHMVEPRDDDRS